MKFFAAAGALALAFSFPLGASAAGSATGWTADTDNSVAEFSVQHLVFSHVSGLIKIASATVALPAGGHIPASVQATLDASSINTENPDRDADLRGPDWLDVAHYPTIAFKSTTIKPGTGDDFQIVGDLTLHGVTKPVTLAAHFNGQTQDGRGNLHLAFSATTKIDRRDFGLLWAHTTPGGSLVAGNDVSITLSVEVVGR